MQFNTLCRHARVHAGLWHVSGKWLIAASLGLALGLWALSASVLAEMRRTDWEQARQSAENIVATIEADIARNIEVYDLSLQAVAENLTHPEINQISRGMRQLVLFDRAATAKHLLVVLVNAPFRPFSLS